MKLDVKKTVTIGLAFMTINMLWQVYNWEVPKVLESYLNTFTADAILIGIIMALDNLFAIFMIPLSSNWSDRTSTKIGKRMPFIFLGIIASAIAFFLIPFTNRIGFWALLINIVFVLLCMNLYRSPCVALMPDVTPPPLRNRANSIINIMGGVGTGIGMLFVMILGMFSDFLPYVMVSVVMIGLAIFLRHKVNEPKLVEECKAQCQESGVAYSPKDDDVGTAKNTNKRNIIVVLLTVFLIYMATNAVDTFMSLYGQEVFGDQKLDFLPSLDLTTLMFIPYGIGMFGFAVPAALLADKIGRPKTIAIGCLLMAIGYTLIALLGSFSIWTLVSYLPVGIGFSLAIINVYPMTIENCSPKDTGKYTGFYYIASMSAQTITPALVGLFISEVLPIGSMTNLFPYATIFILLAALTASFGKKVG